MAGHSGTRKRPETGDGKVYRQSGGSPQLFHRSGGEAGGRRASFDGTFTDGAGLRGRIGPVGSDAAIGWAESPPGADGGELLAIRKSGRHRAIVVVTRGGTPGLSLLNAPDFIRPVGPPVLQIASQERDWLRQVGDSKMEGLITVEVRRTGVSALNVTAVRKGRIPRLAPVVVMARIAGGQRGATKRSHRAFYSLLLPQTRYRIDANRPTRRNPTRQHRNRQHHREDREIGQRIARLHPVQDLPQQPRHRERGPPIRSLFLSRSGSPRAAPPCPVLSLGSRRSPSGFRSRASAATPRTPSRHKSRSPPESPPGHQTLPTPKPLASLEIAAEPASRPCCPLHRLRHSDRGRAPRRESGVVLRHRSVSFGQRRTCWLCKTALSASDPFPSPCTSQKPIDIRNFFLMSFFDKIPLAKVRAR